MWRAEARFPWGEAGFGKARVARDSLLKNTRIHIMAKIYVTWNRPLRACLRCVLGVGGSSSLRQKPLCRPSSRAPTRRRRPSPAFAGSGRLPHVSGIVPYVSGSFRSASRCQGPSRSRHVSEVRAVYGWIVLRCTCGPRFGRPSARQRTREPRPPFVTESDAAEDAGPCVRGPRARVRVPRARVRVSRACAAAPAPLRADSWAWNGLTARSFRSAFP